MKEFLKTGIHCYFLNMLPEIIKAYIPQKYFIMMYDKEPMVVLETLGYETNLFIDSEFVIKCELGNIWIIQKY